MSGARELVDALDTFADIDAPLPCWLGGDHANQGPSYCRACAEKAVEAGKGEFVDGGWDREEAAACVHCEECGRVLNYRLTSAGVGAELDHFEQNPPTAPLCRDAAFHIARMVDAAPDEARVLTVGRAAVALIPSPAPRQGVNMRPDTWPRERARLIVAGRTFYEASKREDTWLGRLFLVLTLALVVGAAWAWAVIYGSAG